MQATSNRPSIDCLTSLRGIAALLVVLHHMGLLMLPLRGTFAGPPLEKFGLLGMSIFFVLSGFVIHYNYADRIYEGREKGVMAFLFARFARLYPLYFLVVIINFAYNVFLASQSGSPATASIYVASLPAYLTGTQSWFYSVIGRFNMSISQEYANNTWSISSEVFLYLIFIPLAMNINFKNHSLRRGIAITLIAILGRVLIIKFSEGSLGGDWLNHAFGIAPTIDGGNWLIYFSPYGRFLSFFPASGLRRYGWHRTASRRQGLMPGSRICSAQWPAFISVPPC